MNSPRGISVDPERPHRIARKELNVASDVRRPEDKVKT
jgi:hypothetical protein